MVKLTYCLHQIATFLITFPKTPILAIFDSVMAIWPYGNLAIMASNGHKAIWPLWLQIWPLWVFSETAIKMWQSGEDSKSIRPSHLLQRLNIPATPRKSAIATQTGELSRFGKITRICQEIANKADPETWAVRV